MTYRRDLVILLADLDAENVVKTLIEKREKSLGIRQVSFDVVRHTMRDSGCCREAGSLLRTHLRSHHRALVLFDQHGSGRDGARPEDVEMEVEEILQREGWEGARAACIVLAPELESWVWSPSPAVDDALGWTGRTPKLRDFLVEKRFVTERRHKPSDPKAAMKAALRKVGKPHSARVFAILAENVSIRRCQDRSFGKFVRTLRDWFALLGE